VEFRAPLAGAELAVGEIVPVADKVTFELAPE